MGRIATDVGAVFAAPDVTRQRKSGTRRTGELERGLACSPDTAPDVAARLSAAKWSFNCRNVDRRTATSLQSGSDVRPLAGDVVLARVTDVGQHTQLHLPGGRRTPLYPGDEIVICYGNRYAPEQFEAIVPANLEPCDLVAAGGIAGHVREAHPSMREPTPIAPVGLVADAKGEPINLRSCALPAIRTSMNGNLPSTVAVVGTSMDSGKTTALSCLTTGLTRAGVRVGGAKVTGTGASGDFYQLVDAGAQPVYDFVDAGHPSTYMLERDEVLSVFTTLVHHVAGAGADLIVLEIADGLFQRETVELVESSVFTAIVDQVVFTAREAMGAVAGVAWLRERGISVPAVSGLLTASALASRETERALGLPVLSIADLTDPRTATRLVGIT